MSSLSPVMLGLALVLTAALAIGAVMRRRALVMSLPFLVILDGLAIPVAGSSLHLHQVAACLLVVPLAASVLIGERRLRTDATTWWLAAILVMNVLASVLNSPALSYSLRQCANLASVWIIYVVVLNFLDTREELDAFLTNVLWAAIIESGIGVAAYLLAVIGAPLGGAEVSASAAERLTKAYGAYGTMVEPNILGSFTAAHLVIAAVMLAVAVQRPVAATLTRLLRWVAASAAAGLVLSFTRAAWLGAVVGIVWFTAFGARMVGLRARPWRILAPLGVGLAGVVVLVLLPGYGGEVLQFKLLNLLNLESQTAVVRVLGYTMALQQTLAHPIIGWGTFTFAPLVAQGNDFQQFDNWRNLWIGNFLLLALHDTGVIGLSLWGGMVWTVVRAGVRAARVLSSAEPIAAGWTLALTAAVVSMLISFLSTSGFTLGFPWLLIGLLGAHSRVADAAQDTPVSTPQPASSPVPLPVPADVT